MSAITDEALDAWEALGRRLRALPDPRALPLVLRTVMRYVERQEEGERAIDAALYGPPPPTPPKGRKARGAR